MDYYEMSGKANNGAPMRKYPGIHMDKSLGSVDKGISGWEFIDDSISHSVMESSSNVMKKLAW